MPKFEVSGEVKGLGIVKHTICKPNKEQAIEKFKTAQPDHDGPIHAKPMES